MAWLCSADSHFQEPGDLWIKRVSADLKDRAPVLRRTDAFEEIWLGDKLLFKMPLETLGPQHADVPSRLAAIEQQGIWAELLIGNQSGIMVLSLPDPDLAYGCAAASNDYLAETYGPYRDRQLAIGLVPISDIARALKELERAAKLGLAGVTLPIMPPEDRPYYLEEYEPIWAAAAAHGLPVSFHANTGGRVGAKNTLAAAAAPQDVRTQAALKSLGATSVCNQAYDTLASLLGAGVLARHPDLHIVFVECEAGWMATAIRQLDYAWAEKTGQDRLKDDTLTVRIDPETGREEKLSAMQRLGGGWPYEGRPSDYIHRQVHATFQDEPAAVEFRHVIGIEQLLWGSDFPHPEGTYPHTRRIVDELFAGVDRAEREAITGGTLAKLYGIRVPEIAAAA